MAKPLPARCPAKEFSPAQREILPEKHISESLGMEKDAGAEWTLVKRVCGGSQNEWSLET